MKNHENISTWERLAIWCFALLLETISAVSFLGYAFNDAKYLMGAVVFFHVAAGLMFFFPGMVSKRYRNALDRYKRHCYGWLVMFIPYIGMLGCAVIAFGRTLIIREDTLSQYKDFTRRDKFRELYMKKVDNDRLLVNEALDIQPIRDILEGDDISLKTGAIHLLSRRGHADDVWMLQNCLSDVSEEVRYFAHLALLSIEEGYTEKIENAKKRTEVKGRNLAAAFKELGQIYMQYSASGLVDEKARGFYLDHTRDAFLSSHRENPDDGDVTLALGQIALENGNTADAVKYFRQAMPSGECILDAWLGIWRAYYEERDFNALAAAVQEAENICHFESSDKDKLILFEFWRKRGDDATAE